MLCMEDLGIPINQEDLTKPSTARCLQIFQMFTDQLLTAPAAASSFQLDMLDNPEIHHDSYTLLSFYRQFAKLLDQVGVERFCLRDLLKPEPKRILGILSALINFCKFREERLFIFEDCTSKSEKLNEQKRVLESKIDLLTEKINSIRLTRADEAPTVEKLKAITAALGEDMIVLRKRQAVVAEEIERAKQQKADLTEKITSNQFLVDNLKADCVRLKSRIVSNPEKLKQVLKEMSASLREDKATVAASERKSRELQGKIDTLAGLQGDVQACVGLANEALAAKHAYNTAQGKLDSEKEALARKEGELSELALTEQQISRQLASAKEKLSRLEKHLVTKNSTLETSMQELKTRHAAAVQERAGAQNVAETNEAGCAELEQKLSQLDVEHAQEVKKLNGEYEQLNYALEEYQATLSASMTASSRVL